MELLEELKDSLKITYGNNIYEVKTPVGSIFFKQPNRTTLALALSYRAQHKVLEAGDVLVENCIVHGRELVENNEQLSVAVSLQIANIIELPEVTVKKV